jgi:integrase
LGKNRAILKDAMDDAAQTLPKKSLPDPIRRELKKGETIYHSTMPCHVSAKNPEGKWIAQVRREEKGKLVKYPVKGYSTPREALNYIKTLRPDEKGRVAVVLPGEPKVRDLYEYAKKHRQKRLTENTKAGRESRWRLYIEPEWADMPLSKVTRRAAQEWITTVENSILNGESGTLGIGQFEKVRTDLHWMFEALPSFSSDYEDRRNPFAGLDFLPRQPRPMVTIESQHFAAIESACLRYAQEGLCTSWIAEVFLTSLWSGLREGEVLALCRDQLDFEHGAILVDRALRRKSRAIDPKTRLEKGPVLRQAMHLPKGGSPTNDKSRVVPMADQLARLLKGASKRNGIDGAEWNLLWPGEGGNLKEIRRFQTAWATLRQRLHELATLAPLHHQGEMWPEIPKRPGWTQNPLVEQAREDQRLRVPDVFDDIVFRDTRNSFASYMNEVGLSQATREHFLGHGGGLTNTVYTVVTSTAFQEARRSLSRGWKSIPRR